MPILLTRIDNRLIHGQILEAWLPHLHADCLVVANDEVAASPLKRMMMEASVPNRIEVIIGTVKGVAELFRSGSLEDRNLLLLFATVGDSLAALRLGLRFDQLNLGNLHAGEGKVPFCCTVYLSEEDIANLDQLCACGVDVRARCVPADSARKWKRKKTKDDR